MAQATVTPPMRRKAETLAALVPMMSKGCSKATGQAFVIVPGSVPTIAHWATATGCTCVGFQRRGVCTHSLAVKLAQTPAPKPAKGYSELFPTCSVAGCTEDAGRSGRCMDHAQRLLAND
jgi:hypothetical protein